MNETSQLFAWVSAYGHDLLVRREECGASELVTMVILVSLFAAAAIAIATIIITKFTDEATSIPTG